MEEQKEREALRALIAGVSPGRENALVFGEGPKNPKLMLIGEGPGQQEDETGRPFVGAAGHLLDRMLAAIGLRREQVYICNIVKCRPPQNRVPEADERAACMDYLRQQVALVRPKVIVCLGSTPTRALLGEQMRITRDRAAEQSPADEGGNRAVPSVADGGNRARQSRRDCDAGQRALAGRDQQQNHRRRSARAPDGGGRNRQAAICAVSPGEPDL